MLFVCLLIWHLQCQKSRMSKYRNYTNWLKRAYQTRLSKQNMNEFEIDVGSSRLNLIIFRFIKLSGIPEYSRHLWMNKSLPEILTSFFLVISLNSSHILSTSMKLCADNASVTFRNETQNRHHKAVKNKMAIAVFS